MSIYSARPRRRRKLMNFCVPSWPQQNKAEMHQNKYRLVGRSAWPRCLAYQMQPIQSVTQCITRMSPQLLKRHIGQNLFPAENTLKNMHVPRLPPSLPLLWWYLYAFYVTLGPCIDYFVPRRASPNLINAVPLQNGNYVLRHSFPLECQTGHRPACSSG